MGQGTKLVKADEKENPLTSRRSFSGKPNTAKLPSSLADTLWQFG